MSKTAIISIDYSGKILYNKNPIKEQECRLMGLGTIEVRNTTEDGLHVVRLSNSGRINYKCSLRRGYKYILYHDHYCAAGRVKPPKKPAPTTEARRRQNRRAPVKRVPSRV